MTAELKIKYIPEIFPDVDFEEFARFNHVQLKELPAEVTTHRTSDRWQTTWDRRKTHRIKQSIVDRRFNLVISLYESTPIGHVQATDHAQLKTTDNEIYDIYDISLETDDRTPEINVVTLSFKIKEFSNISNPVAHSNLAERSDLRDMTTIRFITKKVFWSNYAYYKPDGFLYFDLDNDKVKPRAGEFYYLHTNNPSVGADAYMEIISVTDLEVKCQFLAGQPDSALFIFDMILNDIPETVEYSEDFKNETNVSILTQFIEKRTVESSDNENVTAGDGREFKTDLLDKDIIEVPFFLKPENLNLYRYLKRAKYFQVGRENEGIKYIGTEDFEIIENIDNEAVDLHEFRLKLPYNIDRL